MSADRDPTGTPFWGRVGEGWGLLGVALLVGQALVRLTPIALDALRSGTMTPLQWAVCAVWVVVNAHAEGYRGFHRRFVPRTIARARHLGRHPTPRRVALAPMFCMGLFGATRRVVVTAWTLVVGISLLILWVRGLPQPWRGIVDAGVVVGLGIGWASLVGTYVRVRMGRVPIADPALREPAADPR